MRHGKPSITQFLTDGSLVDLCSALAGLASARVRLTDERGREITRDDEHRAWIAMPPETDSTLVAAALARATEGGLERLIEHGLAIAPILADAVPIGAIVMDESPRSMRSPLFEHIERVAISVAMAAGQFCTDELALRRRNAEQAVLYRLSSLLVGTTDLDSTFHVALRSAAEIFEADAGCVCTLSGKPPVLTMQADLGLSAGLREHLAVLPADDIVDREALDGKVVRVDDLLEQGRALHLEAIASEGFRGMLSFGITYQGKRLGLMRLYTRTAFAADRASHALLRAIAEQVAAAVASAQAIERAREHRAIKRQLRLAADVQRRMFPRTTPTTPGLDVAARYEASYELGGDFYDIIELDTGTALVIGDVVGKGVAAALLMSSTRAFIRAHMRREPSIGDAMGRVNRALCRDTLDNEFVTALVARYDPGSRELTLCSGGHDPPLLARRAANGRCAISDLTPDNADGMALGIDPSQAYRDAPVALEPGDIVVATTDGAHEAMDFNGNKYGRERLASVLEGLLTERPNATAKDIVDHLVWEIRRYTGLARASDDITMLVLRVLPDAQEL